MKNQLIPGQTYQSVGQIQKIAKRFGLEEATEETLFSVNSVSAGAIIEYGGKLYWANIADQQQLAKIKTDTKNSRTIVAVYVLKVPTQYDSLDKLNVTMQKSLKKNISLFEAKLAISRGKKVIAISKESDCFSLKLIEELPERHSYHSFWG